MALRNTPIQRKLMTILLLTSGAVVLLTCAAFVATELLTFRQAATRNVAALGEIIAANSTAALAFDNQEDAAETLSALAAEPQIVAAALYDVDGRLFAKYPASLADDELPVAPAPGGYRFEHAHLLGWQPVVQGEQRLGALYLNSDLRTVYQRLRLYGAIAVMVIGVSLLVAYLLSEYLQRQISRPILALAETAKAVSARQDYSVRATKISDDELGLLTDAFNHMLTQIQAQSRAVHDSEARVRAVLNSALSAVLVMDGAGRVVDWNARAQHMFGWTREEALGRDLGEVIIPRRYREAHRRGLVQACATGQGAVFDRLIEMSALRRDGSEFPVELSVSPLKSGDALTFCGFITDITERKAAESKLQAQLGWLNLLHRITRAIGERLDLQSIYQVVIRTLEDSLPIDFVCACIYEPGGDVLTVSNVGIRSQMLAAELAMTERARIPIDQNGLSRCVHGQLVYEPDIRDVPYPFPQRLAARGLRAFVAAPLLVENRVFGILLTARREAHSFSSPDCEFLRQLSEHVALAAHQATLYEALQQAYDDLRQTQQTIMLQDRLRALGQMASGIAHDINNAISPIALYTESLLEREPGLSTRARDYLVIIQRATDDVATTVARMRDFYRQRETQLTLAPIDLNQLVQQVLDLTRARWRDLAQERGIAIDLHTEFASELAPVMGAEAEIRDALTNLVFNSVDAMPEGGTLTLRTRAVGRDAGDAGARMCIEVTDSGIGMDEETRRRCLEPFFTTKGERGTGLGLAMVYGMVQRHSAELEIDSDPGRGTTLRLLFPIPAAVITDVPYPAAPKPPAQCRRLLVVDDDPLLIKSLCDTLEGDGHVIVTADGGQAGIEAFEAAQRRGAPFALVITDLGMPHVDGRKVAAAVKGASPDTPVVLLTGWGQRLLAEDDIPPHVDRVLSKPPKLHELRTALAELTAAADVALARVS